VFRLKVPAVAKKLTISSIGYATREVNLETGEMSIALSPVSTA
jgi:iron complex outermembrane receptor protein